MSLPLPMGLRPQGPSPTPLTTPKKTLTPSTKRTHLDKVCLVIYLEGFCLGDQFLPRELGWFDWTGQHRGSIHYKPSVPWPNLLPKDRPTAYYCTTHIYGLLYYLAHELKTDAQHLYEQYKTAKRSHIDLEPLGCPKFNYLLRLSSVGSCGQHEHPLQLHCPQVECYHFVQWMRGQRGLSTQPHYRHFRFFPERM